jgi:hypothetical protein
VDILHRNPTSTEFDLAVVATESFLGCLYRGGCDFENTKKFAGGFIDDIEHDFINSPLHSRIRRLLIIVHILFWGGVFVDELRGFS